MTELKPLVHRDARKPFVVRIIEEISLQLKGFETAKEGELRLSRPLSAEEYETVALALESQEL